MLFDGRLGGEKVSREKKTRLRIVDAILRAGGPGPLLFHPVGRVAVVEVDFVFVFAGEGE